VKREVFERENKDRMEIMCCSETIFLPTITELVISFYPKQKDTWVFQMMGKERGHHNRREAYGSQGKTSFRAFTGEPTALLGLLVSQTTVVGKTKKIEVRNLAPVDLWLRVLLCLEGRVCNR